MQVHVCGHRWNGTTSMTWVMHLYKDAVSLFYVCVCACVCETEGKITIKIDKERDRKSEITKQKEKDGTAG